MLLAFIRVMVGFVKKGGLIDNSKKGQITIFIILGLVILFIAGFFIFYIQEAEKPMGKEPGELPTEFLQVENFIEECLYDTSIDAFELLGSNGGYINPQEYFTKKIEPTESEVLEFSPGSELWLPYWWYLDSGNDCIDDCSFASNRPALTRDEGGLNIEEMLDEYIETHLSSCINDFSALSGEFEIVETGEIEVETIIAENDVLIDLSYPIEIESMKSKGEYSRFRATLDIDFRKIYEFATDLTNAEAEGNFLEYNLMNLMASYSGMESHLLPPMEGTKFEFGSSVFWLDTDIKSNMEEMLMSYVPIFRVAGTKNYNPNFASGEDPLTRGLFNQFVLVMENKTYPTLNVNFNYLAWWPIYLYITPNQGGLLSPSGLFNTYMPFLGIQRFRFVYDVGYPVLVEITDDNAFHGDGYTFMVALESNIINNMPINVSKIPLQMISASGGQSMVCNLNQRNSGNITINIVDGESDLPLADVSIYFNLGTESCIIGQTDVNGNFVGKFPIGLGELNLQKFDYEHYIMPYFTKLAREDEIDIVLEPYRYKNVSIVKKTLGKSSKM